jgi:glycosyltransferase involved in cell wall biosynthesis
MSAAFTVISFLCIVKVVFLHQHFKTPQKGGAIRSYYLAKALVEKGAQTIVITAHEEHNYKREWVEGIEVHYLPVAYDNRFGFYKRLLSFFKFAVKSSSHARQVEGVDLCYAISTPLTVGLAAKFLWHRVKVPYIFEVGDLWPDAPIQLGIISNSLVKKSLYWLEKNIYKNAKSIVALSPPIAAAIGQRISGKVIHLLPNMADTDFFKPEDKRPVLTEKWAMKGKFVISYIGAVGLANGLNYYLKCAMASQEAGLPVEFLLCGDGAKLDELKQFAAGESLKNVTFVPFQDRNGVADILNISDASFICYQPVKILETGSPNKYFDALAAGKLVIINFGGWIRDEIEKELCGFYVNAANAADFARKVEPFVNDSDRLKRYQQASRTLAERKYSRRVLGERFWDIIKAEA